MVGLSGKLLSRAALAAAGVLVLVTGAASAATAGEQAGNTSVAVWFDGHARGQMTHIDSGDYFKVCDRYRADGKGVNGILQWRDHIEDKWVNLRSEGDAGDRGCDTFQYDVGKNLWNDYRLKICWYRVCNYAPFKE